MNHKLRRIISRKLTTTRRIDQSGILQFGFFTNLTIYELVKPPANDQKVRNRIIAEARRELGLKKKKKKEYESNRAEESQFIWLTRR